MDCLLRTLRPRLQSWGFNLRQVVDESYAKEGKDCGRQDGPWASSIVGRGCWWKPVAFYDVIYCEGGTAESGIFFQILGGKTNNYWCFTINVSSIISWRITVFTINNWKRTILPIVVNIHAVSSLGIFRWLHGGAHAWAMIIPGWAGDCQLW